jgi:hypothetical protein
MTSEITTLQGFAQKSLSLRSRRKHKAWGASPRIRSSKQAEARENGRQREISSLSPAIAGSRSFFWHVNLGLAPQDQIIKTGRSP